VPRQGPRTGASLAIWSTKSLSASSLICSHGVDAHGRSLRERWAFCKRIANQRDITGENAA
jgi:hypothetical protein